MTVSFNMAVVPTTFHLGFACLLIGLLWKFYLTVRDFQGNENSTPFEHYLNLTKPKLTLLVIFSALIGLILSPEHIGFLKGALSIFAITLMVASAAALNCFLERDIDGKMERTKNRSLPAGRISPKNALTFGLVLMSISLFLIFSFFNLITGLLGILSIVVYLFIYTPMKRKSEWAVLVGAIPGAIPPLMGYTSASGSIDTFAMVLFAILFIWQIPHFFAISIMYDKDYSAADILVFPNTRGLDYTNRLILKFSFLLLYVAMIPWFLKLASEEYRNAALVLSGILIYFAIKGRTVSKNDFLVRNWAKTYFLGTIFYIPFLFAALVFFK
jgi:heme o synthase